MIIQLRTYIYIRFKTCAATFRAKFKKHRVRWSHYVHITPTILNWIACLAISRDTISPFFFLRITSAYKQCRNNCALSFFETHAGFFFSFLVTNGFKNVQSTYFTVTSKANIWLGEIYWYKFTGPESSGYFNSLAYRQTYNWVWISGIIRVNYIFVQNKNFVWNLKVEQCAVDCFVLRF